MQKWQLEVVSQIFLPEGRSFTLEHWCFPMVHNPLMHARDMLRACVHEVNEEAPGVKSQTGIHSRFRAGCAL